MRPRSQNQPQVKGTLPSARTCRCRTARSVIQYVTSSSTASSEFTTSVSFGTTIQTVLEDLTHELCNSVSFCLAARTGGFPKSLSSDSFRGRWKFAKVKLNFAKRLRVIKRRKSGL